MPGLDHHAWWAHGHSGGENDSPTEGEDRYRITKAGVDGLRELVDDEERLEVEERVSLLLALEELEALRAAAYARCN